MTSLRPRAVHVVAAVLAVVLGGTTPAYAETRTTPDAVGDPLRTTYDFTADEGGVDSQAAPEATKVDVISTRYDYRREVLVVRSAARAAGRAVDFSARVRTSGRNYYFSNAPGGRVSGFQVSGSNGGEVRCPAARSRIDAGRGTYRLSIPAACFGAPASVRLGFQLSQSQSSRRGDTSVVDDANREGGANEPYDLDSTLGPKLRRGAARTVPDATGDPVRTTVDFDGDESEPTPQPAPDARKVDLVSTRYDYRRTVVEVRGTAEEAGRGVRAVLRVRAAGKDHTFLSTGKGRVVVFDSADEDGDARCAGGTSSVDARRGTYTMRVPAACFQSPAKARFGFGLFRQEVTNRSASFTVDDATRNGYPDDDADLRLGRALSRD